MKASIFGIIYTLVLLLYNLAQLIANALKFNDKFALVYAISTFLVTIMLTFLIDNFIKELKK